MECRNGAQFAGILCQQILRRKKRTFQLTPERGKKKIPEEEISLEHERVHARNLNRDLCANPMRHFSHHAFTPLFLKP